MTDSKVPQTIGDLAAAAIRASAEGAIGEIARQCGETQPAMREALGAGILAAGPFMVRLGEVHEHQRRELENMREVLASSKEVAIAMDVNYYAEENERMRATFQRLVDEINKGDGTLEFQMSGCEWCHQVWPKPDGSTQEQVEERARRHIYTCAKHPLRIERDALRDLLAEACRMLEREGLNDEAADLREQCGAYR